MKVTIKKNDGTIERINCLNIYVGLEFVIFYLQNKERRYFPLDEVQFVIEEVKN